MVGNSTAADIRARSASLCRLVSVLCVLLWGLLLLERFGAVTLQLYAQGLAAEPLRRLAYQLVAACPEVFYLLSLWWIRQALAAFARGELFAPTLTRMLDRVGVMLAIGAFINTFLVPAAARLPGYNPGYWIAFDISGLVLGSVGLALTVIARVLRQASRLQTELDEIF